MITRVKQAIKALLAYHGYELRRHSIPPSRLRTETGRDAPAYHEYQSRWPIYSPWTTPGFHACYDSVIDFIAGNAERAYMLRSLADYARGLPGDFAECGVFKGGSAWLLSDVLEGTAKKLRLFDSFQGLSEPDPDCDPYFKQGEYAAPLESVAARLARFGEIIEFHVGWIPDSFIGLEGMSYALAHIDLDLYRPTLDACAYFYPKMTAGGVMVFDEYGFPAAHGEKVAADRFFADKAEKPISLITGQAFVIKQP